MQVSSIQTHDKTFTAKEAQPPPPPVLTRWFQIKPDYLLPKSHEHFPIRGAAKKLGGAPCVFRLDGTHPVEFTPKWQFVAADAIAYSGFGVSFAELQAQDMLSPLERETRKTAAALGRVLGLSALELLEPPVDIVKRAFTHTYGDRIAFMNGKGFNAKDGTVVANWITGENLGAPNPVFDQIRSCGTVSHEGELSSDQANFRVKVFDWYNPPSDYDRTLIQRSEFTWAVVITTKVITKDPLSYAVNRFPKLGAQIPVPVVAKGPVTYSMWYTLMYEGERRPICNPPNQYPWRF